MKRYAQYMRDQVTELMTGYGKIDIIWFDFSYPGENGKGHEDWESEKLYELVQRLQPGIIVDNRLDLPESADIVTPEQYTPDRGMVDADGRRSSGRDARPSPAPGATTVTKRPGNRRACVLRC